MVSCKVNEMYLSNMKCVTQAHTAPIRSITYTHNDRWILSTDDSGLVRLWTPRLELAQVGRLVPVK